MTDRTDSQGAVGSRVRKTDIREKVSGEAEYGSDLDRDDLLHGAVVRSRDAHADLVAVDTDAARAMEGVRCVVTRGELLGPFDDRLRHDGDVVAAVAAETRETARRAARRVEYECDRLETVSDPFEALRPGTPTIHEDPDALSIKQQEQHGFVVENDRYRNNVDDYHIEEVNDVEEGFADADVVLEEEYTTPRVAHCNLDTHCCVAEWEGGTLRLVETVASPTPAQRGLAGFLGLDREDVEIRMPPTASSSFGGQSLPKLTLEPVAATLAAETDRPVKLWFDREEDFIATETRHKVHYTVKMGVTAGGEITALSFDVVTDTGAYPNGIGHVVLTNGLQRPLEIYEIPNYRFEGVSVYTNNLIGGEFRGIGSTQVGFVLESHIDELAREAGFDPVELRRRNFVEEGYERPNTGVPIESCGVRECVSRGWETFDSLRRTETGNPHTRVGWGLATAAHTTGSGSHESDSSEAGITLREDGSVLVRTGAVEHGQGSDTVMAQIVSEETGVPVGAIDVERFSSADDLNDELGSVASRATYIVGAAVRNAAITLRDRLVGLASASLDVPRTELTLADGAAVAADGTSVDLTELLRDRAEGSLTVVGEGESSHTPPSYGAHFAEVEVDLQTGAVDVLTYVAAQDVGFAINPDGVEGQLQGSTAMGIEFALLSELRIEDGHPRNANLPDYPAISPHEMPETFASEIIEANEESGPYGAKGVGTPSLPPVAPALLNAVRSATGRRFTDPPVTAETVHDALDRVTREP